MKKLMLSAFSILLVSIIIWGCGSNKGDDNLTTLPMSKIDQKVSEFKEVELTADISHLSEDQKEMLTHLIDAARIMDDIFWQQAFGDRDTLLNRIGTDELETFVKINYGPWERLSDNQPFIEGYGPKPAGANFYPQDMTKEEFNNFEAEDKTSLYTLIRRDKNGDLLTVPYSEAYSNKHQRAAGLLREAAKLAANESFKKYLNLRAEALLSDDYLASDMAWMDVKNNDVDFVVGPIENYEDNLFGYKAAHEAFLLIKDRGWSEKLNKFNQLMPELQKSLPVEDQYKQEMPGSDSDLGVYEAVYYAGDCNAGSKTIAINLPNDERVQIQKGTRKLQLKNAMRYKFEEILAPISDVLIDPDQRQYIKFDAFFENTMFHEVAHGLGIKETINDKGTVRNALKEYYSPIEEGKADIIGLFLVKQLAEMGELEDEELKDNYVTFMASIFRSIRFGAASSHGKANMMRFNYFKENGAFTRDPQSGTYQVNFEKMTQAMNDLGEKILVIQGQGDYEAAQKMVTQMGNIREDLRDDLQRLSDEGIPRDIRFKQGKDVLGLSE
ncbi:MAG: Zn-dependent hydrolase [Bacteroidales bacterium]|nr:Zn-dependent hydrolase [Bacteroidales bacterium]